MSNYRNVISPVSSHKSIIADRLSAVESRSMHGQIPVEWVEANDFTILDSSGNKYIDFTSAIFVANVGHGNSRVRSAVEEQLKKPLVTAYSYPTQIRADYLEELTSVSGIPESKAFLLSAGTETTDAAVKLIKMWGRKTDKRRSVILSFSGNWHGRTAAAQSLSDNAAQRSWIAGMDFDVVHLPFPYEKSGLLGRSDPKSFVACINDLEASGIDSRTDIAGIVFESFQGWSASFYPKKFVQQADRFCKENEVLMCFDEMQAGFGRTGKMFGYMHYEVVPDLICCGKGMGNGFPLAGVIGKAEVMDLPAVGNMSSTHSANPIGCAAGLAVLGELEDRNLVRDAADKGAVFLTRLAAISSKYSTGDLKIDVSGRGLVASLIFSNHGAADIELSSAVADKCVDNGLLVVKTGRESIKFGPPLTIEVDALLEGLDVLEHAIFNSVQDRR